ncbi:MAG TPA: hypothetical protein ENK18_26850 [Deltaproteobacteria bacterium]|nr:hypothetical protein [Deltaproteobacteria bacterium]
MRGYRDLGRSASLVGSVVAALAASACCVGPLIFALLGIGGAGLLVALEPYRPVLMVVTAVLLGTGFLLTTRPPAARAGAPGSAGDGCGCGIPRRDRAGRRMLWLATGVVGLVLLSPYLTPYLLLF